MKYLTDKIMKNIIIYIFAVMMIVSCNSLKTFYQVYDVTPVGMQYDDNGIVFSNGEVKITYDLWANHGYLNFKFENLSNKEIYLCMPESFYISNDIAYDYFAGRTTGVTNTVGLANFSGVVNSAYGHWGDGANWTPGEISIIDGGTFYSSVSNSIQYKEQEYIAIPPKTTKVIKGFKMINGYQIVCDENFSNYPSGKTSQLNFSFNDTPLKVKNHIAYSNEKSDQNLKTIENEFWLAGYTNYPKKKIIRSQRERDCDGEDARAYYYKIQVKSNMFVNKVQHKKITLNNHNYHDGNMIKLGKH